MNKSETLRSIGRLLFVFPLLLVSPFPGIIKLIFLSIWFVSFVIFFYPQILAFAAFLSYQKMGKERYLKLMIPAYKSARLDPKSAATLSYVLLRDGDLDLASEVLDYAELRAFERKKWRKGEMKYNHVHSYRALILWKQDRLNDAAQLLLTLLLDGYKTSILYANLGWFLIRQEKYSEALEVNLEALDYDRSLAILDNVGLNYLRMGDLKKSREYYEEIMNNNPEFPDAWFNYGTLLDAEGLKDEAQEMYRKALTCKFTFLGTITKEEIEQAVRR